MTLFELVGKIFVDNSEAKNSIGEITQTAENAASKFETTFTKIGNTATSLGKKLAPLSAVFAGMLTASISSAIPFEDGMAKMSTLFDTTEYSVKELSNQFLQLSNDVGKSADELVEAGYQALSASVDMEHVVGFVETSSKLAKVGYTQTDTAVDVLTTTINAYNLSQDEANSIANKLIKTQNEGKVTVDELASSIGKVIPTTASMGVNIDNLCASYIVLTKNGLRADVATTRLSSMFRELGDSGTIVGKILKEETGKSFQDLMAEGKSLGDIIEILGSYAQNTGMNFNELWGSSEAGAAASSLLTSGFEAFDEALISVNDSAGTLDEGLEKIGNTTGAKLRKSLNEIKNSSISLGTAFLESVAPALDVIASLISGLADGFNALPDGVKQFIAISIAAVAALGPLLLIFGSIFSAVGKVGVAIGGFVTMVSTAFPALGGTFAAFATALTGPVGAVIAVIGAVIAAFVLLYNNCESFRNRIDELFSSLKTALLEAGESIKGEFSGIIDRIKGIWEENNLQEYFGAVFEFSVDRIALMFENIINMVILFIQVLTGNIEGASETMQKMFDGNIGQYLQKFQSLYEQANKKVNEIDASLSKSIKDKITSINNWIGEKMNGLLSTIRGIADKMKNVFNFTFTVPKIKLPQFSITPPGWKAGDLLNGSIPSLSVTWHKDAMDTGIIANTPTIINRGGRLVGIGDSTKGSEVYAGTNALNNMIKYAVSSQFDILYSMISKLFDNMNINIENVFEVDGTPLYKKSSEYTQREISRNYKNELYMKGV